jgi:hypothetical protein
LVTFPMTDAEGAMNVSLVVKGFVPQKVITGLWRVKICRILGKWNYHVLGLSS